MSKEENYETKFVEKVDRIVGHILYGVLIAGIGLVVYMLYDLT